MMWWWESDRIKGKRRLWAREAEGWGWEHAHSGNIGACSWGEGLLTMLSRVTAKATNV